MNEYWFITYSWVNSNGKRIEAHAVHDGTMGTWIKEMLKEPEQWILLNQTAITKATFDAIADNYG